MLARSKIPPKGRLQKLAGGKETTRNLSVKNVNQASEPPVFNHSSSASGSFSQSSAVSSNDHGFYDYSDCGSQPITYQQSQASSHEEFTKGICLLTSSAMKGNPNAQYTLGLLWCNIEGEARDEAAAFDYFYQGAEQDNVGCCKKLADLYREGFGIVKDLKMAAVLYKKATTLGSPIAAYCLASMYFNGEGVPPDNNEAIKYLKLSANGNFVIAQLKLGLCLIEGKVTQRNFVEAFFWLRKASEQNNGAAQNTIGELYRDGMLGSRDLDVSIRWFRKAIANGDEDAKLNLENALEVKEREAHRSNKKALKKQKSSRTSGCELM